MCTRAGYLTQAVQESGAFDSGWGERWSSDPGQFFHTTCLPEDALQVQRRRDSGIWSLSVYLQSKEKGDYILKKPKG